MRTDPSGMLIKKLCLILLQPQQCVVTPFCEGGQEYFFVSWHEDVYLSQRHLNLRPHFAAVVYEGALEICPSHLQPGSV